MSDQGLPQAIVIRPNTINIDFKLLVLRMQGHNVALKILYPVLQFDGVVDFSFAVRSLTTHIIFSLIHG